ncbi:hypothetical protein JW992_12245 [candidate division KSB1 bacterium]|nr:hypothetical protein [candidate division KSB1 bacterium]
MSTAKLWYSRPIFITSTFRDMDAERDHLRTVVFPELEERLKNGAICSSPSTCAEAWKR